MRLFRARIMEAYGFSTDTQVTNKIKEWSSMVLSDNNPEFEYLPIVIKARLKDLAEANKTLIIQNPIVEVAKVVDKEIDKVVKKRTFELDGEEFDQVYTKTGRTRSPEQQLRNWTTKNVVSKDMEVEGDAVQVNGPSMKTVFTLMDYVDMIINKCASTQTMAKYKERILMSAKKCKL